MKIKNCVQVASVANVIGNYRPQMQVDQIHPVLNSAASARIKDLFEIEDVIAAVAVEADYAGDDVDATFWDVKVTTFWDCVIAMFYPDDSLEVFFVLYLACDAKIFNQLAVVLLSNVEPLIHVSPICPRSEDDSKPDTTKHQIDEEV